MATDGPGLLIVNADDLGLAPEHTDAILTAHAAGAITSATAMVWMADSERAARAAAEAGLPTGLHLNLIEPFDGAGVPPRVADTQRRVTGHVTTGRLAALAYVPAWRRDFEAAIADQLDRFCTLYGRMPTHVDGHRHLHLVPNALFSRALGRVTACRRPVNRPGSESRPLKHFGRDLLYQVVRRRFVTTRWCFSIRAIVPALGGRDLGAALGRSETDTVEVMVHPGWADERAVLHSDCWHGALVGRPRGSYAELTRAVGSSSPPVTRS